jgi:HD-GYP domain-containing protein (c-di-GMP phosphodiesterase class II)
MRTEDFGEVVQVAVEVLGATLELRDAYTSRHQERVAELAYALAVELGLDADAANGVGIAGRVHDVGKHGVPAELLMAARPLTSAETEVVRAHVGLGTSILANIPFPWPVAEMVLHHHERLDGSGYPSGLRGDDIGLGGRIVGVADVVEAMSSHRPYRPAPGIPTALSKLEEERGSRYDRDVADACLRLFRRRGFEFTHAPV